MSNKELEEKRKKMKVSHEENFRRRLNAVKLELLEANNKHSFRRIKFTIIPDLLYDLRMCQILELDNLTREFEETIGNLLIEMFCRASFDKIEINLLRQDDNVVKGAFVIDNHCFEQTGRAESLKSIIIK